MPILARAHNPEVPIDPCSCLVSRGPDLLWMPALAPLQPRCGGEVFLGLLHALRSAAALSSSLRALLGLGRRQARAVAKLVRLQLRVCGIGCGRCQVSLMLLK